MSDFIDDGYLKALRVARRRHDLVPVTLTDPREDELPAIGLLELEDAESGQEVLIDTLDPTVRRAFAAASRRRKEERERIFRSLDLDTIQVRTDRPYSEPLLQFFRRREKRFRV